MSEAILQAVIEVPTTVQEVTLTGHSTLRGLTFVELLLKLDADAQLSDAAQATLVAFILDAEGPARDGESDEFAGVFAEAFWVGRDGQPEAVLLPHVAEHLGIGRAEDAETDLEWARLLSRYYNPAARPPGEVSFRRRAIR